MTHSIELGGVLIMKIGFSKKAIAVPVGLELGGYAGCRPNEGVHDPLYCKVIILEQDCKRYALIALDLLCADESLCRNISDRIKPLGITQERLIICAIHSHAAPVGVVPNEGALSKINEAIVPDNPDFLVFIETVAQSAEECCYEAVACLENYRVRAAKGEMPPIGLERHTGERPKGDLTVVQFLTESGKNLIFYSFPCHPTVLNAANLRVSADFVGGIEQLLQADMAVFVNGAAGDISTRFTRQDSSFAECNRMAGIAAEYVLNLIRKKPFVFPTPLVGCCNTVVLPARKVETKESALKKLEESTLRWQQAIADGADPSTIRILKSYVEGAGVNLEFAVSMGNVQSFYLPVNVFSFAGINFVTIPGELYSTLLPAEATAICYANGYYRYIADKNAYDNGHYEALAAIVGRGSGELLSEAVRRMLEEL